MPLKNNNKKIIYLYVKFETWVQNLNMLWIANHNVTLAATFNHCVLHSMIFKKRGQYNFLIPDFIWIVYSHTNKAGSGLFLMVGTALHAGKF